mmetsp:Transcript_40652/g.96630  ORF Transcript_40652/g.96630 Transcript_40652/m.96630 type:complete len:210 (-) Transcript_40652:3487-4116(-)
MWKLSNTGRSGRGNWNRAAAGCASLGSIWGGGGRLLISRAFGSRSPCGRLSALGDGPLLACPCGVGSLWPDEGSAAAGADGVPCAIAFASSSLAFFMFSGMSSSASADVSSSPPSSTWLLRFLFVPDGAWAFVPRRSLRLLGALARGLPATSWSGDGGPGCAGLPCEPVDGVSLTRRPVGAEVSFSASPSGAACLLCLERDGKAMGGRP